MARYVVLSFDDNEEAERFTRDVQAYNQGTVEGIFAKPTLFCPGSGAGGCAQGKRYRAWVQGQKWGWWVCTVCHRPSGAMSEEKRMRATISQGTNILALSQEETASEGEAKTTGREHGLTVFDKENW